MINTQDIHSLTDFARNTREYAKRLKRSKRPVVLTVNGRAEFVVQDAAAYQQLLDMAAHADEVLKLNRSFDHAEAGSVHDFETTATKLKAKHFGKATKAVKKN